MTNEAYPITPPRELVKQWRSEPEYATPGRVALHTISEQRLFQLLTRSAQWGYEQVNEAELQQARDEELEACCDWLRANGLFDTRIQHLRAVRRPKPPSLKEQALKAAHIELDPEGKNGSLIIRALEALPDD